MDEKRRSDEDRVAIPLDPEEALRALLKVDPESEPVERGAPSERAKSDSKRPLKQNDPR